MATMDEKRPQTTPENNQGPGAEGTRGERRRRAHEVLAAQRSYLDRLENELSEGLEHLAGEIARELTSSRSEEREGSDGANPDLIPQLDELRRQLAASQAELDQARHGREQAQIESGRMEQELRVRDALLREAQAQNEQRHTESAGTRQQLADLQLQLATAQERQDQLRRELGDQHEQSVSAQEQTKAQRRRIARELKAHHAEKIRDIELRKAELRDIEAARNTQLEAQLAAAEAVAIQAGNESKELSAALAQSSLELTQARGTLEALQSEVGQLREALEKAQRAREQAAEEFERGAAQANAQAAEIAAARETIGSLEAEIAELREALVKTQADQAHGSEVLSRAVEQTAVHEQERSTAHETIRSLEAEASQLRTALEQAQAAQATGSDELIRAAARGGADQQELVRLRSERESLIKKLSAAETRASEAAQASNADTTAQDDLERRLEMAVEELRELKRANLDLEVKLTKARATGAAPTAGLSAGLDWEAQKQRLLASLEADDSPDDEETVAERHSIEGTIRITDQIVAQKDQEILELRALMEGRPGSAGPPAAAAVDELLDRDETVRQERERLQQLQVEWRQKIGKAETDLSVERARIARERAELAEKMQLYAQPAEPRVSAAEQAEAAKPVRGRWLSRLGLKDVDEKNEK